MGQPDPTKFHTYFNDFDTFNTADWVITTVEAGAGAATEALGDIDGGALVITNDDADDDSDFFQLTAETFKMEVGKKAFFKTRFKVSDAIQCNFIMGLQIRDTTPLGVSDGVFFYKPDGDAGVDLVAEMNSVETSSEMTSIVDDTYIVLAFAYNGSDEIQGFVDDVKVVSLVNAATFPGDEELTVSFGIQNGEAAAKVMTVDYIFACKER